MPNLSQAENTALANVKDPLLNAKVKLRLCIERLTTQADTWHNAGNFAAEAGAFRLRGGLQQALGIIDTAHGNAMDDLCACFDDGGAVIQGGGGGR